MEHLDAISTLKAKIEAWKTVEAELLPAAAKGLQIPDMHVKIQRAQIDLATALDKANAAMLAAAPTDGDVPEFQDGMSTFVDGLIQYNSIIVGVHFGRAQLLGRDDLFEYTLRAAFYLQDKAKSRAGSS